jgi:hypothetical protein
MGMVSKRLAPVTERRRYDDPERRVECTITRRRQTRKRVPLSGLNDSLSSSSPYLLSSPYPRFRCPRYSTEPASLARTSGSG